MAGVYTDGGNPTPRQLRKLLKSFMQDLRKQPEDMKLRLKIAEVLRLLCRFEEAVQVYRTVAWAHAVTGNLVQAIMLCKLILDLSPDHEETQQMLAKLYASKQVRDVKQSVVVQRVGQRWVADPSREVEARSAPLQTGPIAPEELPSVRRPARVTKVEPEQLPGWDRGPRGEQRSTRKTATVSDSGDSPGGSSDQNLRRHLPAVPPLQEKLEETHVELSDLKKTVPPMRPGSSEKEQPSRRFDTVNLRGPFSREVETSDTVDSTIDEGLTDDEHLTDDEDLTDDESLTEGVAGSDTDPSFSVRVKRATMPYSTAQRRQTGRNKTQPDDDAPVAPPTSPDPPTTDARPPRTTAPMSNETLDRVVRAHDDQVPECHEAIQRQVRHEGCAQSNESGGRDPSVEINLSDTVKEGYAGKSRLPSKHQIPVLPLFSDLDMAAFIALINRLERRYFPGGSLVLREGDPGDSLMLVSAGHLQVFKEQDGREIELARLGPGSFFGEFALLADQRRHASVRTLDDVELLELRKEMLAGLVREHPSVGGTLEAFYEQRVLEMVLATSPLFQAVSPDERERVLALFTSRRFLPGESIVEEGRKSSFYVILLGEVTVSCKGDDDQNIIVGKLTEGDYFGEMSLISGDGAEATVTAERTTDTLQLDARSFYELAAVHPEIWAEVQRECEARREINDRLLTSRKAGALLL